MVAFLRRTQCLGRHSVKKWLYSLDIEPGFQAHALSGVKKKVRSTRGRLMVPIQKVQILRRFCRKISSQRLFIEWITSVEARDTYRVHKLVYPSALTTRLLKKEDGRGNQERRGYANWKCTNWAPCHHCLRNHRSPQRTIVRCWDFPNSKFFYWGKCFWIYLYKVCLEHFKTPNTEWALYVNNVDVVYVDSQCNHVWDIISRPVTEL